MVETQPTPALDFDDVSVAYGRAGGRRRRNLVTAVRDLNLSIQPGERVALLGPNGAGKSSLLRTATGTLTPVQGRVTVCGLEASQAIRDGLVGFAARDHRSFSLRLSGIENLRYFAALDRVPSAHVDDMIHAALEPVDLTGAGPIPYRNYSSGMKQRLAIARALMRSTKVLILDEAASSLDPTLRQSLWIELKRRCTNGAAVLLATHDIDEALRFATRVVLMNRGEICFDGPPDLAQQHANSLFRLEQAE
ncbi:MAG: ABC transporter ATP-binding protein [Myxococcales bacterium]|nr:ABC transporter ATP-binding protein [Myxococcales bacterium]